jgi:hypothetical protein
MLPVSSPDATAMTRLSRLLALALVLPLAACGGGDDGEPVADDGPLGQLQRMGEAAEQMGEAAEEMQQAQAEGRPPAEPVDFRRLRDLLPETAGGLPRQNAEGQRSGMGEMIFSEATGTYAAAEAGADGMTPTITLKVTDLGGLPSAAMFGAAWTLASIDRESDRDFERTTRLDGHPAYEKYDRQDRGGDFQVFVAERFVVQAQGTAVSDDQMREALRGVDFDALDGMRDEGR